MSYQLNRLRISRHRSFFFALSTHLPTPMPLILSLRATSEAHTPSRFTAKKLIITLAWLISPLRFDDLNSSIGTSTSATWIALKRTLLLFLSQSPQRSQSFFFSKISFSVSFVISAYPIAPRKKPGRAGRWYWGKRFNGRSQTSDIRHLTSVPSAIVLNLRFFPFSVYPVCSVRDCFYLCDLRSEISGAFQYCSNLLFFYPSLCTLCAL